MYDDYACDISRNMCNIGLIQFIGFCFAINDEADMEIVFEDNKDVRKQPPILFGKKKDRKSGVTKREFYTTIPMERWKEKKMQSATGLIFI